MVKGRMYCTSGDFYDNVPQNQTDYVVPIKEAKKEEVLQACKDYILDYWGKKYFEDKRGITIEDMLNRVKIQMAYERYIPTPYSDWGAGVYRLCPNSGRGAAKVWVLEFTDDPFSKFKKEPK